MSAASECSTRLLTSFSNSLPIWSPNVTPPLARRQARHSTSSTVQALARAPFCGASPPQLRSYWRAHEHLDTVDGEHLASTSTNKPKVCLNIHIVEDNELTHQNRKQTCWHRPAPSQPSQTTAFNNIATMSNRRQKVRLGPSQSAQPISGASGNSEDVWIRFGRHIPCRCTRMLCNAATKQGRVQCHDGGRHSTRAVQSSRTPEP
jgi:hypothetical protein